MRPPFQGCSPGSQISTYLNGTWSRAPPPPFPHFSAPLCDSRERPDPNCPNLESTWTFERIVDRRAPPRHHPPTITRKTSRNVPELHGGELHFTPPLHRRSAASKHPSSNTPKTCCEQPGPILSRPSPPSPAQRFVDWCSAENYPGSSPRCDTLQPAEPPSPLPWRLALFPSLFDSVTAFPIEHLNANPHPSTTQAELRSSLPPAVSQLVTYPNAARE